MKNHNQEHRNAHQLTSFFAEIGKVKFHVDDYGYYYGINSSEYNHYRIFKENGYETIGLYYPYYLIGSKVEKYIDHSIYTSGFLYESVWNGKFEYYAQKKKREDLSHQEYLVLQKCLDLVFDSWILFYKNLRSKLAGCIINRLKNEDINGESILKTEFRKYENDRNAYIDTVLDLGMNHPLSKVNDYDYNKLVIRDFVKEVYSKNTSFFKKIETKEFGYNLRNNFPGISPVFNGMIGLFCKKKHDDFRYIENWGMSLWGNKFMKQRSMHNMWQIEASMMNQINAVFDYLDNRKDNGKPFYISMHTEEPHNRLAYFTYDIDDYQLVREELKYLAPLIDNLGEKYSGHIVYQWSLRYVDLCIKRLVEGLQRRDLLKNTTLMIMADHGSSYTLNPLRKTVVNNFYIENYKTPLVIWRNQKNENWQNVYSGNYQGGNVFPTLCEIEGIDTKGKF